MSSSPNVKVTDIRLLIQKHISASLTEQHHTSLLRFSSRWLASPCRHYTHGDKLQRYVVCQVLGHNIWRYTQVGKIHSALREKSVGQKQSFVAKGSLWHRMLPPVDVRKPKE